MMLCEPEVTLALAAIAQETDACKAQDHHAPSGKLGSAGRDRCTDCTGEDIITNSVSNVGRERNVNRAASSVRRSSRTGVRSCCAECDEPRGILDSEFQLGSS